MPLLPVLLLLLSLTIPAAAAAQLPGGARPHLRWRTVETEHFRVHYPVEMAEWSLHAAAWLEPAHEVVSAMIGYAPRRRIDVVVDDPFNVTNGMAMPLMDTPTLFLWPTPPDPGSGLGEMRDWAELLVVHEYAHLAHLVRPSRNPRQRLLWRLSPVQFGPVMRRAPRWVTEGYATYVEGRVTGSGRPHGVARAAILRQWALEGRLPTYAQLSSWNAYLGGAMAYMVGSAYFEWLVAQRGEESLQHLWRRMSARQDRTFDAAFAGVFGASPAELYGRFTVDVTAQALAAMAALEAAGLEAGDTVQAPTWSTGAPAVSPDGTHLAIPLRSRTRPARVVVWTTAPEPADTAAERRRLRLLELDPEDVPAVETRPRPRRALATLHAVGGRGHDSPRFMPDGEGVLVTRSEPQGDGTLRPDLFLWSWRSGRLRRVTDGAAIRAADPLPDGRGAVGVRCLHGSCDLVRIDLADGGVATLQPGSPTRAWHRPRVSPDGTELVASMHEGGVWRLVRVDLATAAMREVGPADGVSRYDADWLAGGAALVAVSERGGSADLERIDLATGAATPLTRVTGGVAAPAPSPTEGAVFFLNLRTRGFDVHRIHVDSTAAGAHAPLPAALWPVVPPARTAGIAIAPAPLPQPRRYGFGPRSYRLLPGGGEAPDGGYTTLALASTDPVGRLSWLLQGALGEAPTWSGVSLRAEWRGARPAVGGGLFMTRHRPSLRETVAYAPPALDAEYAGALLTTSFARDLATRLHAVRGGASAGSLDGPELDAAQRRFVFGEYDFAWRSADPARAATLSLGAHAAAGETAGAGWWRAVGSARGGADFGALRPRLSAAFGTMSDAADVPAYEHFALGGVRPPLFDTAILAQRAAMPALPFGVATGRRLLAARAELALGALVPYAWAASVDGGLDEWIRVAGVEYGLNLATMPLVRLPGMEFEGGVGYILDEPLRERWRGYFAVRYRP